MRFSMRTHSVTRFTLAMRTFGVLSRKPSRERPVLRAAADETLVALRNIRVIAKNGVQNACVLAIDDANRSWFQ
jgi:hypothetical protein